MFVYTCLDTYANYRSGMHPYKSRGDDVLVVKLHHCSVSTLPHTNLQRVCQVYKCSGLVHLYMRCDQGPE